VERPPYEVFVITSMIYYYLVKMTAGCAIRFDRFLARAEWRVVDELLFMASSEERFLRFADRLIRRSE